MSQADDIRALASEARPAIEGWLEAAELIAAFRDVAKEKKIEWSQLKAVIVASIKDEADSGKRLKTLADTADNRLSYAAIFLKSKGAGENKIKLSVVSSPPPLADKSPPSQSVASPSPRSQSDGAAASNSPAPPSDTAASNSEIEGAVLPGPHLNGRIEPLGNDGLDAPSSLPDDGDVRGSPFDRNRVEACG